MNKRTMNMNTLATLLLLATVAVGCADGDTLPEMGVYRFGDDGYMPEEKREILTEAVSQLNAELGFEAVEFAPGDYYAQGMFANEPAKPGYFAWTFMIGDGCAILVGKLGAKEEDHQEDVYTVMHELLHCFGVKHNSDHDSLMFKDRVRDSEKTISDAVRNQVKAKLVQLAEMEKRKVRP